MFAIHLLPASTVVLLKLHAGLCQKAWKAALSAWKIRYCAWSSLSLWWMWPPVLCACDCPTTMNCVMSWSS